MGRRQPGEEVEEGRLRKETEPGEVGARLGAADERGEATLGIAGGVTMAPLHALSGESQLDPQVDRDLVSRFR